MANRQTRGRQRIPISLIQNQDDLYATFSKRRMGLYKKASELSTICGVDTGVIIFSPTNNPYSFFHPTMESVVNRYRNPNQPQDTYTRAVESSTRSRIDTLNRELDEVLEQKQAVKERGKYVDEIEQSREKGWWDAPIESLNREQVKEWIEFFQGFKGQVESRIQQLENGGSTSIVAPSSSSVPMDQYYNYNAIFPDEFAAQDPASFYNYVSQQDPVFSSTTSSSYQVTDHNGNGGISHYMYPQPPQDPSSCSQFFVPQTQDPSIAGGN